MNIVLIEQIVAFLIQAVQAGIQFGPEIIADIKLTWQLATSGTTMTPAQQTLADTTLASAHATLQAQVAIDAQADTTEA